MPTVKFNLKSTDKSYEMPWDDDSKPPTSLEMKQYAFEQDNKSLPEQALDWMKHPIDNLGTFADKHPTIRQGVQQFLTGSSPELEDLKKGQGITQTAGPGLMEIPGAKTLSSKIRNFGARSGNYGIGFGSSLAADAVDFASSGVDPRTVGTKTSPIPDVTGAPQLPRGRRWVGGPSSLDNPNTVKDAEFTEVPQAALPSVDRKALPPAQDYFYGGRKGVSTNIEDVAEPFQDARTPEEQAQNALIPERFKPYPSSTGVGGHFQPVGPIEDTAYTGTGKLEGFPDNTPKPKRVVARPKAPVAKGAEDTTLRPYIKVSDGDVAALAESGDQAAIIEAGKRPSLSERLSHLFDNEKGAIGDQSGPKTTEELAAELNPEDEAGRKLGGVAPAAAKAASGIPKLESGIPNFNELLKKFGGKLRTDENGFIVLGAHKDNPYLSKFADWVNNVKSSKIEGILKGREFKDLDGQGFDAIDRFQQGDRSGRLADVQKYFDGKLQELDKAGVKLNPRENYLPQLWEDNPAKVQEVYRRLGLKPSFSQARIFEDYAQGKAAGLTPKFKTIGDLAGWYEQKANKAIYDRQFYDFAKKSGWIQPQGKGGEDWKVLDPNHFPAAYSKGADGTFRIIPMTAPPELHELVSNYLGEPNKVMQWMADKASFSKNLAMSSGVPTTGLNAHGFNIMARTVIGNPKEAFTAGKYLLNPKSAGRYLDASLSAAPEAVKSGLQLTTEGHEMGVSGSSNLFGKGAQTILKVQGKLFEDPLFQKVIPALKLKHWSDIKSELVSKGMAPTAAAKSAAEVTNNLYGGINWEAMGRSRDLQNLLRMTLLAPDWLESNARLGVGMGKTLLDPKNPGGHFYAKIARNIVASYIAADVVNHSISGHHMWENGPGHALDVQLSRSQGKDRFVRPFGTAEDFIRLPFDTLSAALDKNPNLGTPMDIAKNRMSIPGRVGLDLLTKRDKSNKPILGRDDYGRPIPVGKQLSGVTGELSSLVTPPYVKSMIDYGTGNTSGEEALVNAGEIPIRYQHAQKMKRFGRRGRK